MTLLLQNSEVINVIALYYVPRCILSYQWENHIFAIYAFRHFYVYYNFESLPFCTLISNHFLVLLNFRQFSYLMRNDVAVWYMKRNVLCSTTTLWTRFIWPENFSFSLQSCFANLIEFSLFTTKTFGEKKVKENSLMQKKNSHVCIRPIRIAC